MPIPYKWKLIVMVFVIYNCTVFLGGKSWFSSSYKNLHQCTTIICFGME